MTNVAVVTLVDECDFDRVVERRAFLTTAEPGERPREPAVNRYETERPEQLMREARERGEDEITNSISARVIVVHIVIDWRPEDGAGFR